LLNWRKEINRQQWQTLFAAHLGWMLDGFDVMLYAFALQQIKAEFTLQSGAAGALASATLVASAIGGSLAGILSDRLGRARVLVFSILFYSVFTGLTATATNLPLLILWRALVGIGLGAEWSAGSVLVSETWPARYRGIASGLMQAGWALGYIAAALLSALILPQLGWRLLFLLGVIPALVTWWIRRNVPEPEVWSTRDRPRGQWKKLLQGTALRRLLLATLMTTMLLFAYWGVFTWLPSYLALPPEKGGVGLSLTQSVGWIVAVQLGAFAGYVSFGFLADRWGRRPTFIAFVIASAVIVPIYGLASRSPNLLFYLGPLLGFFGHGYFSLFGAYLSELFDTSIRGTAQGICYNIGRAFSALAPMTIGALADQRGMGAALAITSAFYVAGAVLMLFLPETKGESLT
jgi:MFS family permease